MQEKHLDKNKNECLKIKSNRMVFSYEEFTLENLNIFEMPLLTSIKMAETLLLLCLHQLHNLFLLPWLHTSFSNFSQLLKFLG